ncbi:MAG: uroporphyrinogen decarboxylase family protein [Desulfobacterium sp.]|jgi:uroporphyrinogen decarboxylase|nr:uroporphyrinogen decarboxylase family protein [Desulfobacterium sp.]
MITAMTPMERVLSSLSHREPDRVPLFLLLSLYGARESGMSVEEYFSKADNVIKAQLQMQAKYGTDCYYTFFYAALETEAWGGKTLFVPEGPPNSGTPVIQKVSDIDSLWVPNIYEVPGIQRVLEVTRELASRAQGEIPLIGVVMSPFSLPVMQMGFEQYINLIYHDKIRLKKLMEINQQFCLDWANAQLKAGATAICYFNPLCSTDIIDRDLYLSTGYPVDSKTIAGIKAPVTAHMASGRALPIIDEIINSGAGAVGVGGFDNLTDLKKASMGKISLIGNLNGIEMTGWDSSTADKMVRNVIEKAAPGGGFILSDSHGEIPWQVPEDVLLAISHGVQKWGHYPISGMGEIV